MALRVLWVWTNSASFPTKREMEKEKNENVIISMRCSRFENSSIANSSNANNNCSNSAADYINWSDSYWHCAVVVVWACASPQLFEHNRFLRAKNIFSFFFVVVSFSIVCCFAWTNCNCRIRSSSWFWPVRVFVAECTRSGKMASAMCVCACGWQYNGTCSLCSINFMCRIGRNNLTDAFSFGYFVDRREVRCKCSPAICL